MKNWFLVALLCVGGTFSEIHQCQELPKWTVGGKEIPHNKDGISVLGVLDAKCGMCIRQAAMFNELKDRLASHGMTNIDYNIISMVNGISDVKKLEDASPSIPVHQETLEDKAVEVLGAGKDHFLILDGCNRLVYQVIMPWSILTFPYVKAAILSAYNDKPCGECNGGTIPEPQHVTITVIKHVHKPLPQVFEATFTRENERNFKKHHHLHHHRHSGLGHHHHHHHHHPHSHKHQHVYHNFDTSKMTTKAQYDALKTFLVNHLMLLDIHNQTFHIHSQGNENDYRNYHNVSSSGSTLHTTSEHDKQSDIFGNGVVHTDELTKVPQGIDPIRVEQMEGHVQEGHEMISKDEILSQNTIPLKIILWYPHYHIFNGKRLKDHYYLVLNSRDPTYHGHMATDDSEEKEFGGEKEHHEGMEVDATHHVHGQDGTHMLGGVGEAQGSHTDTSSIQQTIHGYNSGIHHSEHTSHTSQGHSYSFNTTQTHTSEIHHQNFGSEHSHTSNEISGSNKTDMHGKETLTGTDHHETVTTIDDHKTAEHGVSHGQSTNHHGTVVTSAHGHKTEQHEISGGDKKTDVHGKETVTENDHQETVTTGEYETKEHTVSHEPATNVHKEHQTIHESGTLNTISHGDDIKTETHTDQVAEHEQHAISGGVPGHIVTGSQNQFGTIGSGSTSQSESSAQGHVTHSQSGSYSSSHSGTTYSSSHSSSSSSSFSEGIQQGHEYSAGLHGQGQSTHDSTTSHIGETISATHGQITGDHEGSHGESGTEKDTKTYDGQSVNQSTTSHEQNTGTNTSYGESVDSHAAHGHSSHSALGGSSKTDESSTSHSYGSHGSSSYGSTFSEHGQSGHSTGFHSSYGQSSSGFGSSTNGHSSHQTSHHGESNHSHSGSQKPGEYDDKIIFRDDSKEESGFHKFLEKYKKEHPEVGRQLRTVDEEDVNPEAIEKTKDGEELIKHYSKILPWIEYPID